MKNKRIIIFVFAILAILSIGIGYAALTDTLTFTSTVGFLNSKSEDITDSDAMDVVWTNYHEARSTVVSQGERAEGKEVKHNASDALIDVENDTISGLTIENMCVKGDKVIISYNYKNLDTSEFSSRVTVSLKINGEAVDLSGNVDGVFSYAVEIGPINGAASEYVDLAPGAQGRVMLTVTMEKTLFEDTLDAEFEIQLDATSIG